MNRHSRRNKVIIGLVLVHVLLGIGAALLGDRGTGRPWAAPYIVAFSGLVCGQVVLLGIWSGLTNKHLGVKMLGASCGSLFDGSVLILGADIPHEGGDEFLMLAGLILLPVIGIALLFTAVRTYVGLTMVHSVDHGLPTSAPLRFTVRHILGVTTLVALLLGLGKLFRASGGESIGYGILVFTFASCGFIVSLLAVWATLYPGRPWRRIPVAIGIGLLCGLAPPWFLGGPEWRFLVWPALIVATGLVVLLSLLVIRYCGYRLVPVNPPPEIPNS